MSAALELWLWKNGVKTQSTPRVLGLAAWHLEEEADLRMAVLRNQLRGFKGQLMYEQRVRDMPDDWDGEGNP